MDYSEVANQQLDELEAGDDADLFNALLDVCEMIFRLPGRAQSMASAVKTDQGIRMRLRVPGHPPYKLFWSTEGPRIEVVFSISHISKLAPARGWLLEPSPWLALSHVFGPDNDNLYFQRPWAEVIAGLTDTTPTPVLAARLAAASSTAAYGKFAHVDDMRLNTRLVSRYSASRSSSMMSAFDLLSPHGGAADHR